MHIGLALALGALLVAQGACSSSGDQSSDNPGGGAAAGGTSAGGSNAGGSSAGGGDAGGSAGAAGSAGKGGSINVGGAGGKPSCGGETKKAEPKPFDMYIMMDKSGSMTLKTQTGESKWEAVKGAMSSFVNDPASEGLGVGIQFFPKVQPGVPNKCTSDDQCLNSGPCGFVTGCAGIIGDPKLCKDKSECDGGAACAPLGLCSGDENAVCVIEGDGKGGCKDKGDCLKLPGYCSKRDSCEVNDYATPAQAIELLPGAASKIVAAMDAQQVDGETPLGPALIGTVTQAQQYAAANAGHTVTAVLVTDGLPRECTPLDIPGIAAEAQKAATAAAPVKTYIVGVIGANDLASGAQQNLDQVASAGGTSKAFIIDAKGDVQKEFLKTLNQIRGAILQCDYDIPSPTSGPLIYDLVNVEYTPGGGGDPKTLSYVGDATKCGSVDGGWYYDVDPSKGKPSRILLCSASCDEVQADTKAEVDVRLGCPTVTVEVN